MKTIEITGTLREALGKKETKLLRKQDLVPCEVYGGGKNIHFYAHENEFRNLVYSPDIFEVKIKVGKENVKAIMQEIQFHPVTDKILHIDFLQVFDDKKITINVPVELEGFAIGVQAGGQLNKNMRSLRVKAFLADMPEKFVINVEHLSIGKSVKINELEYDDKLELLDTPNNVVAAVKMTRSAMSEDEELAGEEGEEAAEGEAAEGEATAEK